MIWRIRGIKAGGLMRLGEEIEAENEYEQARDVIRQLAENISDEIHKQTFLSSPLVAAVLNPLGSRSGCG
jgi:predicted RNA polymerase sigma factor